MAGHSSSFLNKNDFYFLLMAARGLVAALGLSLVVVKGPIL